MSWRSWQECLAREEGGGWGWNWIGLVWDVEGGGARKGRADMIDGGRRENIPGKGGNEKSVGISDSEGLCSRKFTRLRLEVCYLLNSYKEVRRWTETARFITFAFPNYCCHLFALRCLRVFLVDFGIIFHIYLNVSKIGGEIFFNFFFVFLSFF